MRRESAPRRAGGPAGLARGERARARARVSRQRAQPRSPAASAHAHQSAHGPVPVPCCRCRAVAGAGAGAPHRSCERRRSARRYGYARGQALWDTAKKQPLKIPKKKAALSAGAAAADTFVPAAEAAPAISGKSAHEVTEEVLAMDMGARTGAWGALRRRCVPDGTSLVLARGLLPATAQRWHCCARACAQLAHGRHVSRPAQRLPSTTSRS